MNAPLLFTPRARERRTTHQAILIKGAAGGVEMIALTEAQSAQDQLEARRKRLYRGQEAVLISYWEEAL